MIKRILIFIMIFTIIFNFISYDNTYAATLSLGSIYGTELGSEMLAFLLASLAVGVTYKSLAEAEQLFKTSELINWDEILGSAPDPPPGGGQNPNKKLITALLLGVPGGAFLSSIFGDLISWFKGLGATEGENKIGEDVNYTYYESRFNFSGQDIVNNSIYVNIANKENVKLEHESIYVYAWHMDEEPVTGHRVRYAKDNQYSLFYDENTNKMYLSTGPSYAKIESWSVDNYYPPKVETSVKYYVNSNSPVITDILPTTLPQPDISKLPGIETIISPDGQEKVIYPGDFEDLVDEIVNNITFDDFKNIIPGSNPYIVTETQQGLNIDIGTESPFPDVNTDPIEDTSAYQGTTIGLLQSIINWLSLIKNDISSLPDKLFEVPQDLSLNFDNLRLNGFQERFPFSIPWDIASAIGVFSSSPTEPDLTIDMDTNYFSLTHEIDISSISLPLRFARYVASVFFVLYLANKTRDLIKW
jgi:hypothetical protein